MWNKCVYHREGKEGRRKCVHIFKSIIYVLYIYYNRLSEVPAPTSDPMPTRTPRAAAACRAGRVGGRAHLLHHAIAPRIYCIIYCTRLLHHASTAPGYCTTRQDHGRRGARRGAWCSQRGVHAGRGAGPGPPLPPGVDGGLWQSVSRRPPSPLTQRICRRCLSRRASTATNGASAGPVGARPDKGARPG